jgi:hypothetical protein
MLDFSWNTLFSFSFFLSRTDILINAHFQQTNLNKIAIFSGQPNTSRLWLFAGSFG